MSLRTPFRQGIRDFQTDKTREYDDAVSNSDWKRGHDHALQLEQLTPLRGWKVGQWAFCKKFDEDVQIARQVNQTTYIIASGLELDVSQLSLAIDHDPYSCDELPYYHYPYDTPGPA